MTFIWPAMLLFLLVIPLFVALYLRLQRRRQRLMAAYGGLGLAQASHGRLPGFRRHIPPILFLAGLTILVVAMARPQATINLPRVEGTVLLAFDISGSMAADDMEPNRMEAAKAAARDFIVSQPASVQIGIVAFSDNGLEVQAPTNDQNALLSTINRLTPERGTALANGILASISTITGVGGLAAGFGDGSNSGSQDPAVTPTPLAIPEGSFDSAVVVLLTDGENNEPPDPLEAAQLASDLGIRIYTVGIGSAAGVTLNVEGFAVHTRLNEPLLQQISDLTGGAYYNAATEQDLAAVYQNLVPKLVVKPEKMEVTSVFSGASILILLAGGLFSLLWFSRLP